MTRPAREAWGRRAAIAGAIALLLLVPAGADARDAGSRPGRPSRALHDVHLTYSRVVVDGTSILWRVRLFRDDLEKGLQRFGRDPRLVASAPAADSVFAAYFTAQVPVTANGRRLAGRVLESGRDPDVTDNEMWWYLLEFTAPAPVTEFSTRVGLLFEHFTDQRNVLTLLKMPGNTRHSLYFVGDDPRAQKISF